MRNNNFACINKVNKNIMDLKRNQSEKYYYPQIINPKVNYNNTNLRHITSASKYWISFNENS